jgi:hypothetical protein
MVKRYPKEREEQKRQIIDLYLQCKDSLEIANAIGLSDGRVRQIVNKFKTEEINTANRGNILVVASYVVTLISSKLKKLTQLI